MRKLTLALAFSLGALAVAAAIGVDTQELKSGVGKVEFINFTGQHAVVETADQIRGIGRGLAAGVDRGQDPAWWQLKYTAIHLPEMTEKGRFGADLISIEKESRVDHIDNVRRILSAYLEALYRYPRPDADVLALFVSYYNATYRGTIAYFNGKYQPGVLKRLDPQRVGISTKWFEWPGATQIVIPLSETTGRSVLGALDASELSSKAVVEQLKEQPDKGIAERTAITDLKSREAEAAQKALQEQQQRLEEQKRALADQEAAAKAAAEEAARAKAAGDAEAARKAEEAAQQRAAELARQQEEQKAAAEKLAAEQQAVAQRQQEVAREKQEIAQDQAALEAAKSPEQKAAELAQREAEVAQREEAVRRGETDAAIFGGRLYYLKIKEYLSGGHYNNDMLIINAASGTVLVRSDEANICGRKYDISKSGVVIIGHKGDHASGHYLELLGLDDLAKKAVGSDPVFYRSFVEIRDDFVYCIINNPDGYYLGKFNADLQRVAISKEKVDGDSFVSFFSDLLYINREDKQILVLNREDLSTKSVIAP